MPVINSPKMAELLGPFFVPGYKVFVDPVNGDDNYDGSSALPYATLARGMQDIRSGRNDTLVLVGQGNGSGVAEDQVLIQNKSNFAIVGIGLPGILPPTTINSMVIPTAWTRTSAQRATATVVAGHGYTVGTYAFVHGVVQSGNARIRGVCRVGAVTGTSIGLDPGGSLTGVVGDQPYTAPGALGFITPASIVLEKCSNVRIIGLVFTGSSVLTDDMSGLVYSGGTSNFEGSNFSLNRNVFQNAALGFYTVGAAPNLYGAGLLFQIEGCIFSPNLTSAQTNVRTAQFIYLHGMSELIASDNFFQTLVAGTTWTGASFIEHGRTSPGYAYVFTGNRFDSSIPPARVIRSTETAPRIFFEANFYPSVAGGLENFAIDPSATPLRERLALRFPNQDFIPTQLDVIRAATGALATVRTLTGSTTTNVRSTATQATGFYDNQLLVVFNSAGVAARRVASYSNTNGAFTLLVALPFTPAADDALVLLPFQDVATAIWSALRSAHNVAGSFGESVRLAAAGVASGAITAAAFAADAVDASALAASAATEIATAVFGTALPGAFGANTAGERLATTDDRVDAAVSTRATQAQILSDATPFPGARVDVAVSTRAAPGDPMDLVGDAVDATAVAASGAAEIAAAVAAAPSAAAIADAVWDEARAGHVGAGSFGEGQGFQLAAAAGRVRLNTGNPAQWTLELFAEDETTVLRTLNLKDQAGAAIDSTNNPLVSPAVVLFADRDPV